MLALEGILVMNDLMGTKEYRNRERARKEQCSESRVPVPPLRIYINMPEFYRKPRPSAKWRI